MVREPIPLSLFSLLRMTSFGEAVPARSAPGRLRRIMPDANPLASPWTPPTICALVFARGKCHSGTTNYGLSALLNLCEPGPQSEPRLPRVSFNVEAEKCYALRNEMQMQSATCDAM
jgi:hypothetical protein